MAADGFILVVDDDREVQAYLQLALAVLGRPVVIDDGLQVPAACPALAFVDLLLGHRDGLPLIEDLVRRGAPVVAISGLAADAAPVVAARAAGAEVLGKPFTLTELRDVARRLLGGSAQRA
ncbi:MAG: response regulator [Myxococcales bacterium]|nr:response regulator [Myxococcales bacterium]